MDGEQRRIPGQTDATDEVHAEIIRPPQPVLEASRGQPLRPRHVPQRTCVACRTRQGKRELVRIVRSAAGGVSVDPTGRLPGRGAYLHRDPECWGEGLKRGRLARALRTVIGDEDEKHLRLFMEQPGH